ncbi:MAG TPA: hypothetical protein VGL10_05950, partial [Gammaproteobacteria bacterium]
WLTEQSGLGTALKALWTDFLKLLPEHAGSAEAENLSASRFKFSENDVPVDLLKELPLTVLFYEGPIARAYLACMRGLGLKPRKIIQLIAANDIAGGKPLGRYLPEVLRKPYAQYIQKYRIHYWPRRLATRYGALCKTVLNAVDIHLHFTATMTASAQALSDLSEYCDHIEPLLVRNLADVRLGDYLRHEPGGGSLYTGGGIVSASLLSIPGLRFIHIHPGFLPAIRGADCALWSLLLKRRLSASCFYMSGGIDTGDIIIARWLPEISVPFQTAGIDTKMLYRAVYSYLDPWVRAFVLRELLASHDRFAGIECRAQHADEGTDFHFMHSNLTAEALRVLFAEKV